MLDHCIGFEIWGCLYWDQPTLSLHDLNRSFIQYLDNICPSYLSFHCVIKVLLPTNNRFSSLKVFWELRCFVNNLFPLVELYYISAIAAVSHLPLEVIYWADSKTFGECKSFTGQNIYAPVLRISEFPCKFFVITSQ